MNGTRDFDDAVMRIRGQQRTARLVTWLSVLIPASLGIAFLVYGSTQLRHASDKVAELEAQAASYESTVKDLKASLASLESEMQQTARLSRFVHPIGMIDTKEIYSHAPPAVASVVGEVLEQANARIPWRLGGSSPQGFDSPGFAAFVLEKHGALEGIDLGGDSLPVARSERLFKALPAVDSPEPGDLAFYAAGYVLFWFRDQHGNPFVIGMTPSGIVGLNPDFATPRGYRRPRYQR
jgi:hypothetical protein